MTDSTPTLRDSADALLSLVLLELGAGGKPPGYVYELARQKPDLGPALRLLAQAARIEERT